MPGKKSPGDTPDEGLDFEKNAAPGGGGEQENGDGNNGGDRPQDPRMGLARFLQVCPQKSGITALLRSKHTGDVKTMQEWEVAIEQLLHKKVQ
jgi:hypothetical protein